MPQQVVRLNHRAKLARLLLLCLDRRRAIHGVGAELREVGAWLAPGVKAQLLAVAAPGELVLLLLLPAQMHLVLLRIVVISCGAIQQCNRSNRTLAMVEDQLRHRSRSRNRLRCRM